MKGKVLKKMLASALAVAMLLTTVPVSAAEAMETEVLLKTEVLSTEETKETDSAEEIFVEVENKTLKSIDTCQPKSISLGLDEGEYVRFNPGYSIEDHVGAGTVLYVECEHEVGQVKIKNDMCSYYQSDWLNQMLYITVTYKGLQVTLPCIFQYRTDEFVDISKDDWFFSGVDSVYKSLYMTGMDYKHFGPYEPLSRAQFATIIYRMEREPEYTTTKTFPDVPAGSWYEDAVRWAYEQGIITGYDNGNFGPADLITRDQMAVMIFRYAQYYGMKSYNKVDLNGFVDGSHVSYYAQEAMGWVVQEGIITGKDNGTRLAPLENTVRAECAVIVDRFIDWVIYG